MADCEFLENCLFFNDKLENMPTASGMMKNMYDKWHHAKGSRYRIAIDLGKSAVPDHMFQFLYFPFHLLHFTCLS